jgi:hypothetical protein
VLAQGVHEVVALERGDADLLRDGVSYRMQAMWLDDAELAKLSRDLVTVLQPRLANAPKSGRKRWILGTVVMPGPESNPQALPGVPTSEDQGLR